MGAVIAIPQFKDSHLQDWIFKSKLLDSPSPLPYTSKFHHH